MRRCLDEAVLLRLRLHFNGFILQISAKIRTSKLGLRGLGAGFALLSVGELQKRWLGHGRVGRVARVCVSVFCRVKSGVGSYELGGGSNFLASRLKLALPAQQGLKLAL